MAYSSNDILTFGQLFAGNTEAYGLTVINKETTGQVKVEAESKLVYEAVTPAVIQRHLAGQQSIGISPMQSDGNCSFGAIDIDDYKYNIQDVIAAIEDFNLPLCPCYSKSKKLHLYIFFTDPIPAEEVRALLTWYVQAFACEPKTEIFPKQAKTSSKYTFYSWINLPYFNASDSENYRKYVSTKGTLSLETALPIMLGKRHTLREHHDIIESLKYYDAPPCILSGTLLRDIGPGQRNNWLFSAGVYLRLKDENCDLQSDLSELNNSLHEPIPESELNHTILEGFKRKSYFYMCSALDRCNKIICRQKDFGIESNVATGLEFGDLTQYLTDPPYYEWIVNGQKMVFWNEQEMLTQNKFRALCLRQLHLVPRRVKDDRWAKILSRACTNITIIEAPVGSGDFTAGSTFFDLTCAFFNARHRAENITQTALGRVFEDKMTKEYVFTAKSFTDYLVKKNDFHQYQPVEIRSRLQQLGAHKQGTNWRMPVASIPPEVQKPVDIDFHDKDNEDGDF